MTLNLLYVVLRPYCNNFEYNFTLFNSDMFIIYNIWMFKSYDEILI